MLARFEIIDLQWIVVLVEDVIKGSDPFASFNLLDDRRSPSPAAPVRIWFCFLPVAQASFLGAGGQEPGP